ncbi:MAG: hypothetical protein AAGG81_03715, partial [Chlamydiota bacterium]
MRKKILLWGILIALVVSGLAWNLVFAQIVKSYVQGVCKDCFNARIEAESVQLDNKTFTLLNIDLQTHENPDVGGLSVEVKEVIVNYKIHPWTMTLDVDITIDKPNVAISTRTDIPLIIKKIGEQKSLFNIRPNIIINEGVINIQECEDLNQNQHTVYVSASLDFRDEDHGHVAMSFDNPNYTHNSFDVRVRRDDQYAFELEAKLNQLDLARITRTINQLHPTLKQWVVDKGFVDGDILISRKHGKRLRAKGGASLRDLILINPDGQFQAQLGSLALEFFGKDSVDKRTLGTLSIGGESSLAFVKDAYPTWEVKNISGGVRLEKHGNAKMKLVGDCLYRDTNFGFQLGGALKLFDDVQTFLNLSLETIHQDSNNALVEIEMKQIGDVWNSAEITLHQLGYREIQFIQEAITRASKKWSEYYLYDGIVDGEGIAYFKGSHLHNVKINHLEFRDLVFDYYPYEVFGHVDKITGQGSVNFADIDLSKSLNTDFSIEQGTLRFVGTDKELWQLSDINTHIAFRDGNVQRSIVHGSFAGLNGTIEVDWLSPLDIMKVRFSGNPTGLAPLMPRRLQKGVTEKLANDIVTLNASLNKLDNGFHAEGIIEVEDEKQSRRDDIAFGFDIERLNHYFWKYRRHIDPVAHRWKELSDQALENIMPAIAFPILAVDRHWEKRELGISGLVLKNGWLYAEELPLEKYVSPFAFQVDEENKEDNRPLKLSGLGNFHGAFDHTGLSLSYTARDVVLDSENFRMEIETIDQPQEEKNLAVHHVEFS